MRRRIFIILAGLVGLVLIVAATMPFWLGLVTRTLAPRFGVTFSDYTRLGYGRFALTDVVYRGGGMTATVERVELASPVAWGLQRATADGADVQVGKWALTLDPNKAQDKPPEDPNAPSGWVPLRQQLRAAIAEIKPWV